MVKDYLIVHRSVLPEFFELVLEARDLIDNEGYSVSAACDKVNISRSTFYKYKDYIFYPSKERGRKAIFSFKTNDEKGALSHILNVIFENGGSLNSIQGTPIKNIAYITISVDLRDYQGPIEELVQKFKSIKPVKNVTVIAID